MSDHECPICAKYSDREQSKTELRDQACRYFSNPEMVNDDVFFDVGYLFQKWLTGKARHPDPEYNTKLKEEEVTDSGMEFVKQSLIGFATETENLTLFRNAIDLLVKFQDPSLLPLYQGWLNKYFRLALLHGSALNSLLVALESSGETIRDSADNKYDWSQNIDTARIYLIEKMKVIV